MFFQGVNCDQRKEQGCEIKSFIIKLKFYYRLLYRHIVRN